MKKFIFWLLLLSLTGVTNAGYISNNISVKNTASESYLDSIDTSWNGTNFYLKLNVIPDSSEPNNDFEVSISGLPEWLIFNGYNIESDSCTTNIKDITSSNDSFKYTFTPNGWTVCTAIMRAEFTTDSVVDWTYEIRHLVKDLNTNDITTSDNSIEMISTSGLRIIKAVSQDDDNDGYIDWYDLTFNKDIWSNTLDVDNVEITTDANDATGLSFTKLTWTTWNLDFDDWVFNSWELPSIEVTLAHNTYEASKYVSWVLEDWAEAQILTVNWSAYVPWATTTIWDWNSIVRLIYSESLKPDEIDNTATIKLGSTIIWSNVSANVDYDTFTFAPFTTLTDWKTYTAYIWDNVVDIAWNEVWEDSPLFYIPKLDSGSWGWSSGWWSSWGSSGWGWWWGGWGWWGWSSKDYEEERYLTNKTTSSDTFANWRNRIYWMIDFSPTAPNITWSESYIELRSNTSAKSVLTIPKWTKIQLKNGWDNILTAAYWLDLSDLEDLNIDWANFPAKRTGWVMKIWTESSVTFDNDINFIVKPSKISTSSMYYVYNAKSLNGPWKRVTETPIKPSADKTLTFDYNEFGYFVFVKDLYFPKNVITPQNIKDKLKADLKISKIEQIALAIYNKVWFDDIAYYTSFDSDLNTEYTAYAKSLHAMFVALEKFVQTKDNKYKQDFLTNYASIKPSFDKYKNVKERYVTFTWWVAKPNNEAYAKAFTGIEKVIITKLRELRDTNSISLVEYNKALNAYNEFVLQVVVLKLYKHEEARSIARKALFEFYPTYKKEVIVIVVPKVTYGDIYTFTRNLNEWDIWDDVRNLQKILTKEGYFTYNTTWYFGPVTRTALVKFSKERLWVDTNWSFNSVLRAKIEELEYKE